ncbi:MAG: hypothetical protein TR69_WS6001000724 [candidate division WS6 bacterium OLB20]|uniref:Uncharacterized protein n=1 Tax=candidate division WS6 bacterium OLB20 TaxID=1617426 RepID=A0A136LYG8_9BACT|nr:MAG: hypothetical protein TR69_WS6001000724 [candidate division WS6 bacterium OLB20]
MGISQGLVRVHTSLEVFTTGLSDIPVNPTGLYELFRIFTATVIGVGRGSADPFLFIKKDYKSHFPDVCLTRIFAYEYT